MPVQTPSSEGASTAEFKPCTCNIIQPSRSNLVNPTATMSPKCIHATVAGARLAQKTCAQHREVEMLRTVARTQLLKAETGVPPKMCQGTAAWNHRISRPHYGHHGAGVAMWRERDSPGSGISIKPATRQMQTGAPATQSWQTRSQNLRVCYHISCANIIYPGNFHLSTVVAEEKGLFLLLLPTPCGHRNPTRLIQKSSYVSSPKGPNEPTRRKHLCSPSQSRVGVRLGEAVSNLREAAASVIDMFPCMRLREYTFDRVFGWNPKSWTPPVWNGT